MKRIITAAILGLLLANGCKPEKTEESGFSISVSNDLDFDRNEIVSFDAKNLLDKFEKAAIDYILITDSTGKTIRHQWLDYDKDGTPEEFLFIPAK